MSVVQSSLARSGLEVYKTKEEEEELEEDVTVSSDDESDDTTSTDDLEEDTGTEGFKLLNGETEEIHYFGGMYANTFEEDYADISSSGGATFHEIDPMQVYKGKKICLKKEWETPSKPIVWDDLKSLLLGFITEQTYSQEKVELKFCGMDKLMDRNAQFNFTQMHRSEIIEAIIEEAGLTPEVDPTGLNDDIMDFSNESSSSDTEEESDEAIGESSGNIAQIAKKVCKGKKTARDKAQAIHTYIRDHVQYPSPNYYDHHKCPMEVLSSGYSNCCDRARLGHEMANAVGLKNRGVHGHAHVWVQYWIDGDWVNSDPGVSRASLGDVWGGSGFDSVWEFPSC